MIRLIAENFVQSDSGDKHKLIDFLFYIGLDGNVERVFKYLNRIQYKYEKDQKLM